MFGLTTLLLAFTFVPYTVAKWGNDYKNAFAGGWSQVPGDLVVVHITSTRYVCPCDNTNTLSGLPKTTKSSTSSWPYNHSSYGTSSRTSSTTTTSSDTLSTTTTSSGIQSSTTTTTSGPYTTTITGLTTDSTSTTSISSTTSSTTTSTISITSTTSTSSSTTTSISTTTTASTTSTTTCPTSCDDTTNCCDGQFCASIFSEARVCMPITTSTTTTSTAISTIITSSTVATTTNSTLTTTTSTTSGATTTTTSTSGITTTDSTTTTSDATSSTTTTTSSSTPVPTFDFLAFGNPFVTDGTSLGDLFVVSSDRPDRGYANFNNANTGFYVDATGALVDAATGGKAIVIGGLNPAPVRFFTQSYIDDTTNPDAGNIFTCDCSLDASQNLSCDCNSLIVFAADYRGYLYMQSAATPTKKRAAIEARQTTATTPAPVSLSATPAPTTTATSTTTCSAPLQKFNLVSNGSVVTNGSTGVYPVADGVYVRQTDWNATEHYQYCGFRNATADGTDPGFYGGTFSWDPCTGIVTETTYGRLLTTEPSSDFSEAYFMPLDIIISAGGDLCICNIDQTTFAFTCTCGPNSIFQNPPSWQLYIGSYAAVGGAVNYPIAQIVG